MGSNSVFVGIALLALLGCSLQPAAMGAEDNGETVGSRLERLALQVGMTREVVEARVARLLGKPSDYSVYGNNLTGGRARYRDGDWVLEVVYKPGAPAPWVEAPDASMQHYPPTDETVLEYRIERSPATRGSGHGK